MTGPIAIRFDGGAAAGAGHAGRCLPIAAALRARGADARIVGRFDGIAAWLVERSGIPVEDPAEQPCGIDPARWSGAVIDLYLDDPGAVCRVASALPVATVGEASRCPSAGLWIDYHAGSAPGADARRLGGPAYVPLDPRFRAGAGAIGDEIRRVLVLTGGSSTLTAAAGRLAAATGAALPAATVCAPASVATLAGDAVEALPEPVDVLAAAAGADLAVVGAGMTLYELAAAGIPCIAVGLVENQRVVVEGCRAAGIAIGVDGTRGDATAAVLEALASLQAHEAREALAARAREIVDGRGAERIADALIAAWTRP